MTLATRKDHLSAALSYCPEVMTKTVESISDLENHLSNKTVICIGPGLGRNYWADQMLYKTTNFAAKENLPILIDADGLNILSENRLKIKSPKKLILTPHPGEAARLLKTKVSTIQKIDHKHWLSYAINTMQRSFLKVMKHWLVTKEIHLFVKKAMLHTVGGMGCTFRTGFWINCSRFILLRCCLLRSGYARKRKR